MKYRATVVTPYVHATGDADTDGLAVERALTRISKRELDDPGHVHITVFRVYSDEESDTAYTFTLRAYRKATS